ncbi:type II toxin-antitoxin system RelE/ParE family toxin [Sphingomonas sp. SUN019]|uniref:type II toxin-antitoxin system RelE/ParE family toxin n=1 Tax=Sphingomonas sp. SUN019 TaxID=2937788 RepID=UPI002164011D|nr:type II toxin-antitoxin system RelE/ParE family toxin [Sphingomonas sp. SUN019]UVO49504.1 type II toxin-antitoxin system RelE/ParE family toxin [Sphingomonas sp. SUN019]
MIDVTIAPVALAHLENIYDYTFRRWGRAQADKYSDQLLDVIERIAARQVPWRVISADVGVDGYHYRCSAHFVYWRVARDGSIRVVAILHQQMHQVERLRWALDLDS